MSESSKQNKNGNIKFTIKLSNGNIIQPNCSAFELKSMISQVEKQIPYESILIVNNENKVFTLSQLIQMQRLQSLNQNKGDIMLSIMSSQTLLKEFLKLKQINLTQEQDICNLKSNMKILEEFLNQEKNKVIQIENEKNKRLQSFISKDNNKNQELVNLKEHYEDELVKLNGENSTRFRLIEQKLKQSEQKFQQAQIQCDELNEQIKKLLNEKDGLQKALLELEESCNLLNNEMEKINSCNYQYQQGFAYLQNQLQSQQTMFNEYYVQCQRKVEQDINNMQQEFEQLSQKKDKTIAELTNQKKELKKHIDKLEDDCASFKNQYDKSQYAIKELKTQNEYQKSQIKSLQEEGQQREDFQNQQLNEKGKEIKKLKDEINQLKKPSQF